MKFESRTEQILSRTDRRLQLPFFGVCSWSINETEIVNSTASPLGYYEILPTSMIKYGSNVIFTRYQLIENSSETNENECCMCVMNSIFHNDP